MTTEILLRYLHFASILALAGTLTAELALLRPSLTRKEIGRIAVLDGLYGLSSIVLLAAGLTLWLGGYTKPSVYYSQNWIFLTKLGLVGAIGILSIYPTIFFLRNRKGPADEAVTIPSTVLWSVRVEVMLLVVIPLLAGLMARGVGLMNQ
jgi:putative membrane protein